MARGHEVSCIVPNVVVESDKLRCEACGSCPPAGFPGSNAADSWVVSLPPDEPLGQLNLYWPSTVEYENPTPKATPEAVPKNRGSQQHSPSPPQEVAKSPIYSFEGLEKGDIRLLQLQPAISQTAPLHLVLEVYSINDCPEYEAVSYTWGGEGDDSTPVCPVYVGGFWDVLLQTKNCAAMLRYLRLQDRVRTLWVDAICINQRSTSEKAVQIPYMRRIFGDAMRVMVYLDSQNDAAAPRRKFPMRRSLAQPRVDRLEQILRYRYFQRLWVVQELILAPSAVFIFKGLECHADALTISRLSLAETPLFVPWLMHLGQKYFPYTERTVSVLRLTGSTKSTDKRDKLFGILGLVRSGARPLTPDHTISLRHLTVGLFTHCIINELSREAVLLNAVGFEGWGRQPSWVPDWPGDGDGTPLSREPAYLHSHAIEGLEAWAKDAGAVPVVWGLCSMAGSVGEAPCYMDCQASSVDAMTGSLSLLLIHLCRIRTVPRAIEASVQIALKTAAGEPLFLFKVAGSGIESSIVLASYTNNLADTGASETDHIFYAGMGAPLLLRETTEGSDKYKIVAPLHSVWIVCGTTANVSKLNIQNLIRPVAVESLIASFPRLDLDGEFQDAYLEKVQPRVSQLRHTCIARRLRRQIFPGVHSVENILKAIYLALPVILHEGKESLIFFKKYKELALRFVTSCSLIEASSPQVEAFVEFTFPRCHFNYVRMWYVDPLRTYPEDNVGKNKLRGREEERLYWGPVPLWDWRTSTDEDWESICPDVINPSELLDILEHGTESQIQLRTRYEHVLWYLQKNCWETEVLRRLSYAGYLLSPHMPQSFVFDWLACGGSEDMQQFATTSLRRVNGGDEWPSQVVSEHGVDGSHKMVRIF
ncbi:heterokaryon incompatibility protein-domain-containing protein [Echria macrotheca]|uniref:Heterokaryon incompatibility protein-domain-containing protein n=1 Tax=Echria macrotheca TaxID=438768 RepID=A0AAJ0F7W5_9PEZI|nr:heterokaryon incompatibility protein-domain-containing protein [Echria macrotheca]